MPCSRPTRGRGWIAANLGHFFFPPPSGSLSTPFGVSRGGQRRGYSEQQFRQLFGALLWRPRRRTWQEPPTEGGEGTNSGWDDRRRRGEENGRVLGVASDADIQYACSFPFTRGKIDGNLSNFPNNRKQRAGRRYIARVAWFRRGKYSACWFIDVSSFTCFLFWVD